MNFRSTKTRASRLILLLMKSWFKSRKIWLLMSNLAWSALKISLPLRNRLLSLIMTTTIPLMNLLSKTSSSLLTRIISLILRMLKEIPRTKAPKRTTSRRTRKGKIARMEHRRRTQKARSESILCVVHLPIFLTEIKLSNEVR